LRQQLGEVVVQERFRQYLEKRLTNQRAKERADERGEERPKAKDKQNERARAVADVRDWIEPDLLKGALMGAGGSVDGFKRMRDTVRLIANVFYTAARFGEVGEAARCRAVGCGSRDLETVEHILWQCSEPAVVTARRRVVRKVREVLRKAGLDKVEVAVGHAMWRLTTEEGRLMWTRWEDMYEGIVMDVGETVATNLKGIWDGMSGLEYKMAKRGLLGEAWMRTMQGMGIRAGKAKAVGAKLVRFLTGREGLVARRRRHRRGAKQR